MEQLEERFLKEEKLQSKRRLVGSNRNEFLDLPYLVIECAVLPQYKGDKKTCSGYYVDPLDPNKSFSFAGVTIDVQAVAAMKKAAGGE